jgi:hypothetical protein
MTTNAELATRDRLIILAFASPFLLSGLFVMGLGLHSIDTADMRMPGWVVATFGLVFVAAGAAIASIGWARGLPFAKVMGAVMFIGLSVVMHWVAFGAGPRHFTQEHRVNGVVIEAGPLDEESGRRVFGGVAIMLDLILAATVVFMVKNHRRR